jgi:hypothetical protein
VLACRRRVKQQQHQQQLRRWLCVLRLAGARFVLLSVSTCLHALLYGRLHGAIPKRGEWSYSKVAWSVRKQQQRASNS